MEALSLSAHAGDAGPANADANAGRVHAHANVYATPHRSQNRACDYGASPCDCANDHVTDFRAGAREYASL